MPDFQHLSLLEDLSGSFDITDACLCVCSYSYGGYASSDSGQVGAQPVYSVNVQQVIVLATVYYKTYLNEFNHIY